MTLNQYIDNLQAIVAQNNLNGELEVVYAIDEEGNGYKKVEYEPSKCQIENLREYFLELVGFQGDESIAEEDCNAICIN